MVNCVMPNASATPTKPIPNCGNAAANTAAPQPPKVSQNVPNNSAAQRLPRFMTDVSLQFYQWGGSRSVPRLSRSPGRSAGRIARLEACAGLRCNIECLDFTYP